ncbi:helix-turn-helix domain-containing protein [Pseudoalteromonas espejiana]
MDEMYIDALKALSDPTRLRLFWLVVHVGQRINVAEAMDVIGDTQYNVSRNLKMLHKAGLLTLEKKESGFTIHLKSKAPRTAKL